jgi:hypothetical protein
MLRSTLFLSSLALWCVACASVPSPLTKSRLSPAHPEAPEAVAPALEPVLASEADGTRTEPAPTPLPPDHDHAAPGAGTATAYTCPMHPHGEASKPGTCPVCGMPLQPRAPESKR